MIKRPVMINVSTVRLAAMQTTLSSEPRIRCPSWYPVPMPYRRIITAISPIRARFPVTSNAAATARPTQTRRSASLRGIARPMPSTQSGAISNAELQSGVMTSPNAPGPPSPNQTIGAPGAASVGVRAPYSRAAATASRSRNWYWKTSSNTAIPANTAIARSRPPGLCDALRAACRPRHEKRTRTLARIRGRLASTCTSPPPIAQTSMTWRPLLSVAITDRNVTLRVGRRATLRSPLNF